MQSILRVKRKRTDAPLDGLVLSSVSSESSEPASRKRTKREQPNALFKFAETVSYTSFEDSGKTQALQNRILARQSTETTLAAPSSPPAASRLEASQESRTAYRVIPRAAKTNGRAKRDLLIVDVEAADNPVLASTSTCQNGAVEDQTMMANFVPLLKEYLSLREDQDLSEAIGSNSSQEPEEYVYDVYYLSTIQPITPENHLHRLGQLTGIELEDLLVNPNEAISSDDEVGDEADEDSNDEDFYRNDYPDETKLSDYEPSDRSSSPDDSSSFDDSDSNRGYR